MNVLSAFLITIIAAVGYFILGHTLEVSVGLIFIALLLRLSAATRRLARFVEILAIFTAVSFVLGEFGIYYPYSYVLILTVMIPITLMEGVWSEVLFYSPGLTGRFSKHALAFGIVASAGLVLYLVVRAPGPGGNPVPSGWPVDALVVLGLGFSVYIAIFEETIFRSFLFARAEAATTTTSAIFLQAIFYGLLYHRSGVPHGWAGAGLMFLLAAGLGYLVQLTRSIYLPIVVRFLTVLSVFLTLMWLGR